MDNDKQKKASVWTQGEDEMLKNFYETHKMPEQETEDDAL